MKTFYMWMENNDVGGFEWCVTDGKNRAIRKFFQFRIAMDHIDDLSTFGQMTQILINVKPE